MFLLIPIFSISQNFNDLKTHHDKNHSEESHMKPIDKIEFIQNKGQWDSKALYKAEVNGGYLWLGKNTFSYSLFSKEDIERMHHENHAGAGYNSTSMINAHTYRMHFFEANENPTVSINNQYSYYYNYFLGNDESKWASNVPVAGKLTYNDLYKGINLIGYSVNGNFKYDYEISPEANPDKIQFSFEGADNIEVINGAIRIKTSVGVVNESIPEAYQIINGKKKIVSCVFVEIEKGLYGFEIKSYNKKHPLIIDPTVIAATYNGSTSEVYGHTATYDDSGNIFSGGAGFSGGGFPTTAGAYQLNPAGSREMTITKFDPTGAFQIWATHIGGSSDDFPHSLMVNASNELYVLGSSSSSDYPTTTSAYNTSNNGGIDIVVSTLSANGATLVNSTYVGGSGNDGQNSIADNYGDTFKGELKVDSNGDVYVASVSSSTNFPTAGSVIQAANAGGQDGVVFKLDNSLSTMIWGTYIGTTGSSGADASYSIAEDGNGDVYFCGTVSNGYTTTPGVVNPNYLGGSADGYVIHADGATGAMIASTHLGTSARDQAFFVQLDKFGEVYIMGQTQGTMTPTSSTYTGPSTGSYILRLPPDLTSINMLSTFGSFAPTAFLVDQCNNIYSAGHGGLSTLGSVQFEASPGAFNTSGAGFYLMVLGPDAANLIYGTFYGNSNAHVDGGTSRFDPQGVVYENVCSSPGSPTVSWSFDTGGGASWDSYVFKIDFEATGVVATANASDFIACGGPPYNVPYSGSGTSIPDHFWDFGDGNTSTSESGTHVYGDTGTYQVMYIAIDSNSCNIADTSYATILVIEPDTINASIDIPPYDPCTDSVLNVTFEFTGTGADSIIWDMGDGTTFTDDTLVNYSYTIQGVYYVSMSAWDICGNLTVIEDTINYGASFFNINANASPNLLTCNPPFEVTFSNGGASVPNHYWDFDNGSSSTLPNPSHTFSDTGVYSVMYVATDSASCNIHDTAYVTVTILQAEEFSADWSLTPPPLCEDTLIFNVVFTGTGADSLVWDMGDGTIFIDDTAVYYEYYIPGTYTVSMTAYDFTCDQVGVISETFTLSEGLADGVIYVPNVFTPNDDEKNDLFKVGFKDQPDIDPFDNMESYHIEIYNRWGRKVFESGEDVADWSWDGKIKGDDAADGVYFYILSYNYICNESEIKEEHGFLHLTR